MAKTRLVDSFNNHLHYIKVRLGSDGAVDFNVHNDIARNSNGNKLYECTTRPFQLVTDAVRCSVALFSDFQVSVLRLIMFPRGACHLLNGFTP